MELVNTKGTKVCSRRIADFEGEGNWPVVPVRKNYRAINSAHLGFLSYIDGRSPEILCIDGYSLRDMYGVTAKFLKEALYSGNVKILILSHGAVCPCLSVLNEDLGASAHIHTLIIRQDPEPYGSDGSQPLLSVAKKRKAAGLPLRSVSLFLRGDPEQQRFQYLEELRACVGELEVFMGDDLLDWDVDKYFLDGLDHLRKNRHVQWV